MSLYDQFKDLNEEELFNRIDILVKNQEEESYCLDFKHHESLNFLLKKGDKQNRKDELGRDISALANADGGIIIYGIEEEIVNSKEEKNRAIGYSEGFENNLFLKEQFIQNVNSIIQPSLPNIDVKHLKHPENNDRCILVLLVPKTENTSIMALGKHNCYFQRQGTENKKLFHFQIMDINNRTVHPQMDIDFEINNINITYGDHSWGRNGTDFTIKINSPIIKNTGNTMLNS